jgi:ketosteroid isomerase-like protein
MTPTTDEFQQEAERFVAEFAQGWAGLDVEEFIAYFCARFDPEIRLSQPLASDGVGHEALRKQFRRLFTLIPDISGTVQRWAARDGTVFIELELTGTLGGKRIAWTACDVVVLRNGVAVERRSFFDPGRLLLAILRRPSAWPRLLRSAVGRSSHRSGESSWLSQIPQQLAAVPTGALTGRRGGGAGRPGARRGRPPRRRTPPRAGPE